MSTERKENKMKLDGKNISFLPRPVKFEFFSLKVVVTAAFFVVKNIPAIC